MLFQKSCFSQLFLFFFIKCSLIGLRSFYHDIFATRKDINRLNEVSEHKCQAYIQFILLRNIVWNLNLKCWYWLLCHASIDMKLLNVGFTWSYDPVRNLLDPKQSGPEAKLSGVQLSRAQVLSNHFNEAYLLGRIKVFILSSALSNVKLITMAMKVKGANKMHHSNWRVEGRAASLQRTNYKKKTIIKRLGGK